MGGKRPDQHNIDPGEAGATNYKWRGEGRSEGEELKEKDKQDFQASAKDTRSMIPETGVNPAARDHRARRMAAEQDESRSASGRSGGAGRSDDERVDEASEESFPASDPPAP